MTVDSNIVTNFTNLNICYYSKVEEFVDQDDGLTFVTSYSFISGETTTKTSISIPEGADTIRVSVDKNKAQSLIIESGTNFNYDYIYYKFDEELHSTIQSQIEEIMGIIINSDY